MLWSTGNYFGLNRPLSWTLARTVFLGGCLQVASLGRDGLPGSPAKSLETERPPAGMPVPGEKDPCTTVLPPSPPTPPLHHSTLHHFVTPPPPQHHHRPLHSIIITTGILVARPYIPVLVPLCLLISLLISLLSSLLILASSSSASATQCGAFVHMLAVPATVQRRLRIRQNFMRSIAAPAPQQLTTPSDAAHAVVPADPADPARLRWPMGRLPVEIFELITSNLSRAELKALRLVCREFEVKVSAHYFRNVVVPFRAELLSSLAARGDDDAALNSGVISSGMRVFQSFGPHILRFALSLELDEDSLAFPPVKTVLKAVPAFWGIYRWPHDDYRRYQDLESIERAADETDSMREALRCLSKVRDLGLCCDAGLGFLSGPDKAARNAAIRHPVFAARDWRHNNSSSNAPDRSVVALDGSLNGSGASSQDAVETAFSRALMVKRMTLDKMVSDAGYVTPDQVKEAVRLMLATEGTTLAAIDLDGRSRPASELDGSPSSLSETLPGQLSHGRPSQGHLCPLIPSNLTMAQMEMLLELEWAHRAMIQSYLIGLIDNASSGCFNNVTTLTLAKIPSCHLHLFCRDDLWNSIPNVKSVSLGVIADWRRISAPTPGFVEDQPVSPVQAVGKAFTLLNSHIGRQPNIESIHFEWICGGEFAPGSYCRNMYILPAPFFEDPELMATRTGLKDHADQLLNLPHAMHLSLKNCWVSPHVLLQTLRQMALRSLEKLELESVSLSGPPTDIHQNTIGWLVRQQSRHQTQAAQDMLPAWMGLGVGHFGPPPLQPMPATHTTPNKRPRLKQPDLMSWSGIIEHFSPDVKINQLLNRGGDPSDDGNPAPRSTYLPGDFPRHDEEPYQLTSLSFTSCGYAALDLPYLNSRAVLPPNTAILPCMSTPDRPDLSRQMQGSEDKMMGLIIPHLTPQELRNLEAGFGMSLGWEGVYDERVIEDAVADGMDHPGLGRFTGVVGSAAYS